MIVKHEDMGNRGLVIMLESRQVQKFVVRSKSVIIQ